MEKPLERPALSQAIRDYVKQYILDQGLSAGDPLPSETRLAQELGVGRGSVREAIKALQSLGIVEVRHGDGLYVCPYTFEPILETLNYGMRFDATTLSELVQIRVLLERSAIEDAVQQIGEEDLDRLETLMEVWEERHKDIDEEFHCILYGALNNQTFNRLFELFWIASENLDNPIIHDTSRAEEDLEKHQAILDAVKARDPDLARQRMTQHFSYLQERIRRATSLPDA
jgi:DNA-binding FadR family transcriptional regulator